MKNLMILSFLILGFVLTSCQDDDNCVSKDAAGTYVGTKECDDMDAQNVTFEVTSGSSDNQIIVDGVTTFIEDCDIFGSSVTQGTGREIDGDIDGNQISFVETIKVNGDVDFRCVWIGIRN